MAFQFRNFLCTLFFACLSSQSYSAAVTHQQQLAAFFATQGISQLISRIADYSDQLDQEISGSSQACFNSGFFPNSSAPQASIFENHFPLGELFLAHEPHCNRFSGERFYAQTEHSELFIFANKLQQKMLNGFIELCSSCLVKNENQLYANIKYRAPNYSFAFNKLSITEQDNKGVLEWKISGALDFDNLHFDNCHITIQHIISKQPLMVSADSIIAWDAEKSPPSRYLQGSLLLKTGSDSLLLRLEEQGVWINEQLVGWPSITAAGQPCL